MQSEAARTDLQSIASYPDLVKIIIENDYSKQQIFDLNKRALHCKKMSFRTLTDKEEKSTAGFEASKDRMTLLLRANASWGHEFEASLHLPIPKSRWPLRTMLNLFCLSSISGTIKPRDRTFSYNMVYWIF